MGKKPRGGEDIEGKVLDLGESTADEPRTGILYMFSVSVFPFLIVLDSQVRDGGSGRLISDGRRNLGIQE